MVLIRPEAVRDAPDVYAIHAAAFGRVAEADIVDLLRRNGKATISLVADIAGRPVGHILFSPVTLDHVTCGLGLAPLAVAPGHQKCGIGSRLVTAGLEACRRLQAPLVVVLGDPAYYSRFGFIRASRLCLDNEYGADEAFRAVMFDRESIPRSGGLVRYAPEFLHVSP